MCGDRGWEGTTFQALFDLNADLKAADWLDEVKVVGGAVATLVLGGELGEAEREVLGVSQGVLALVALQAGRAAGTRRKEVVTVHGANLVRVPIPWGQAVGTGDLIRAHQATQTHGHHIGGAVLRLDCQSGSVQPHGGEEESAVQEGELVVDCHLGATEDTLDEAGAVVSQRAEHKGPGVIPSSVAVVLHLDVVRVDQVSGHMSLKDGIVCPVGKRLHVGPRHAAAHARQRGQDRRGRGDHTSILTGGGVVVGPGAETAVTSTHGAIPRPDGDSHLLPTGRPLPLPLPLICAVSGPTPCHTHPTTISQVPPEAPPVAATRRELEDKVVALLGPEVLSALLLGPVLGSTHATQKTQHLLLKGREARGVHEGGDRALVITADHPDQLRVWANGVQFGED